MADLKTIVEKLERSLQSLNPQRAVWQVVAEHQLVTLQVAATGDIAAVEFSQEVLTASPVRVSDAVMSAFNASMAWFREADPTLNRPGLAGMVANDNLAKVSDFPDISISELPDTGAIKFDEDPRLADYKRVLDLVPMVGGRKALQAMPTPLSGMIDDPRGFQDKIRLKLATIVNTAKSKKDELSAIEGVATVGHCSCTVTAQELLKKVSIHPPLSLATTSELAEDLLGAIRAARVDAKRQLSTTLGE